MIPDSPHICPLPWISVETNTQGMMSPCCLSLQNISAPGTTTPYHLSQTTLTSGYRSEFMQDLRRKFRSGQRPHNCRRCWNEEDAGRISKRQRSLEQFSSRLDEIQWDNDLPDQLWMLDLKLGNLCNLRCRICGPWSSTRWSNEAMSKEQDVIDKRHSNTYKMIKGGEWPENNDTFWQDLDSLLPKVSMIEFSGGEPFMVMRHYDLLKRAVSLGVAGNIHLHYNTNGTIIPEVESEWQQFRRVEISFSIDNVGKKHEFERAGAGWEALVRNLGSFRQMAANNPRMSLHSCTTMSIINIMDLPDTVAWLEQQGFNSTYLNMLHDPPSFNIGRMTDAARKLVLERLTTDRFPDKYHDEVLGIRRFIENGPSSDGVSFCERMKNSDQYRGEDFRVLYPEMAQAMGYE